jgi:capsular exopolysaccharide synthesis family protein
VSDQPDKPQKPEPDEPVEGAPLWTPPEEQGELPEADIEPEPLYEPELPPDMETAEALDEGELLGETGELAVEAPAGPAEPAPDLEMRLAPEPLRPVPPGGAPRQRVPAPRKIRTRAQRELNQLWGGIFFAVSESAPRVVAVTSALRQEGVTQIATALAMAGVESHTDQRIALVDCNLRHPRIAALLGLEAAPGLSDILNARATLENALNPLTVADSDRDLSVLTAGTEDGQPLGLFRSRQFKSLIGMLREQFDHVILDVPATNLYPDPQVIGSIADGVVLVVHAARTRRETVAEAKKRLEIARAKLLGVVLNRRTYPIPGFLYRSL